MTALMLRLSSIVAAGLFAAMVFGVQACESCDVTGDLYDPFKEAYSNPAGFDTWLATHANYFDPGGLACLNTALARVENALEEDEQRCDEAFIEGSDFWHACYDDADVLYGNMGRAIFAIGQAARGEHLYAQTVFGASAIEFRNENPGLFEALFVTPFENDLLNGFYHTTLKCEECSRSIF